MIRQPNDFEPLLQRAREVAESSLSRLQRLCEKYPDDFNRVLETPSKGEPLRLHPSAKSKKMRGLGGTP